MGNSSYGAGHQNGLDDGYDQAKKELKDKNGLDFDALYEVGPCVAKVINWIIGGK